METITMNVVDILSHFNAVSSKGEARRMLYNGGVQINGDKITDPEMRMNPFNVQTIQIGKTIRYPTGDMPGADIILSGKANHWITGEQMEILSRKLCEMGEATGLTVAITGFCVNYLGVGAPNVIDA